MTFPELIDFLQNRMKMSHIYQPLLIRALVDAGGAATLRQLAQAFLVQDESQLQYYEKRIKEMPVPVLSKHGVVERQGQLVSLSTQPLTFEEKAQIRQLCELKLQEFVQKRGLSIWDYRMLDPDPIPDNLRYQVLAAGGHRCALCGATKNESPLDVDHIIPRSLGGKNELANLQILCAKCNRTKGNKDKTDFRDTDFKDRDSGCVFCSPERVSMPVAENGSVIAIEDEYPVTPQHHLVLPRRHTSDMFSMTVQERTDAHDLMRYLRNKIMEQDKSVVGFNVGSNCGGIVAQAATHAHIDLIPRRLGDEEAAKR